jgi:hypothetical protein
MRPARPSHVRGFPWPRIPALFVEDRARSGVICKSDPANGQQKYPRLLDFAEFQFRYNDRQNLDIFGEAIKGMLKARGHAFVLVALIGLSICGVKLSSDRQPAYGQAERKAENKTNKAEQGESGPDWLFRDAAGFFTLCLVVIGGLQLALFYWQLKLIRESLVDAKHAADAATEAAKAATDQANIAKRTFTDRERPYIFVFGVQYIELADPQLPGYPFQVRYSVANFGNMPAVVQKAFVEVVCGHQPSPADPRTAFAGNRLMSAPVLPAQERRNGLTELIPRQLITGETRAIITDDSVPGGQFVFPVWDIPDGSDIFFGIILQYDGPFSKGHETRATWICNMGRQEFVVWGGEKWSSNR